MQDRGGARRGCAGRLPGCRACEPRTNSATESPSQPRPPFIQRICRDRILRGLGLIGHPFTRRPAAAGAPVKVERERGAGRAEPLCRPGRDRAGAWCGSEPAVLRPTRTAVSRHGRDPDMRCRWATRGRSRRASASSRRDAPARSPLITCSLSAGGWRRGQHRFQQSIPAQMRSQDRTVFLLDTYVYRVRLVSDMGFHVPSMSYLVTCAHQAVTP